MHTWQTQLSQHDEYAAFDARLALHPANDALTYADFLALRRFFYLTNYPNLVAITDAMIADLWALTPYRA